MDSIGVRACITKVVLGIMPLTGRALKKGKSISSRVSMITGSKLRASSSGRQQMESISIMESLTKTMNFRARVSVE